MKVFNKKRLWLKVILFFIILLILHFLFAKKLTKEKIENKVNQTVNKIQEIKETVAPKPRSRTTKSYLHEVYTYATNQAKWKAAQEFCDDNMIGFKIITENELGIK